MKVWKQVNRPGAIALLLVSITIKMEREYMLCQPAELLFGLEELSTRPLRSKTNMIQTCTYLGF